MAHYLNRLKQYVSLIPVLFSVQKSTKAVETVVSINGMGDFQEFQGVLEEGVGPSQGYKQTVSHTEFGKKLIIERKLFDDDQYGIMKGMFSELARAAKRTREKSAFNIFKHAFDTTYAAGGDTLALCSTAHVSSVLGVANQSNYGTSALSYDSYIATRKAMRAFTDDNGEIFEVIPDSLMVGNGNGEMAVVITESNLKSADMEVNAINKSWKPQVIETVQITDEKNWFLMDSQMRKDMLVWLDRISLELLRDKSTSTLALVMSGYYRASKFFNDWRWCYGHNVV